jgi:hypothetical protein
MSDKNLSSRHHRPDLPHNYTQGEKTAASTFTVCYPEGCETFQGRAAVDIRNHLTQKIKDAGVTSERASYNGFDELHFCKDPMTDCPGHQGKNLFGSTRAVTITCAPLLNDDMGVCVQDDRRFHRNAT